MWANLGSVRERKSWQEIASREEITYGNSLISESQSDIVRHHQGGKVSVSALRAGKGDLSYSFGGERSNLGNQEVVGGSQEGWKCLWEQ